MRFLQLAETYNKIEQISGRLETTDVLAGLFKAASPEEIDRIVYLTQGIISPPFTGIEVGMGEKFVAEAIALATGYSRAEVDKLYHKLGDLGDVAVELVAKRRQQSLFAQELAVRSVYDSFMAIAKKTGTGSQEYKIKVLAELINNAKPAEVKSIVRFPLGKLRLGVGEPTIMDALSIAKAGDRSIRPTIERAYNLCSDLGHVARTLYEKGVRGLEKFEVEPFSPLMPALGERAANVQEIFDRLGTCIAEEKYDGFRAQVHKSGDRVEIYSRNLERTTDMFPEIVAAVKSQVRAKEVILEGEALAFDEKKNRYWPFQMTIQRKRKYGVAEMAEELPLNLFAFDLMYLNGKDYTTVPLRERRAKLEKIIGPGKTIRLSTGIIAKSPEDLQRFFERNVGLGLEGMFAKDLNVGYQAGKRGFAWIKFKKSYVGHLADTIDVVIVGYYVGRGKRAEFAFGGLLGAVYEPSKDEFQTLTRVGTGFTEEQMTEFQKLLSVIRVKSKPKRVNSLVEPSFWVEPKYVVTLTADEITKSPMHTCGMDGGETGYALRFPRMVGGIRADRRAEDATSVNEIIEIYKLQKRVPAPAAKGEL